MELESRAVIRAVASDDFCLARIHASDLERSFVRVRSARREEELVQSLRKHFEQQLRELGARSRRIAWHRIGEILRLLLDGVDDRLILVAKVHAHQLRAEVEIALAVRIGDVAALGVDDVQRVPSLLEPPRSVVRLARNLHDLLGGQGLCVVSEGFVWNRAHATAFRILMKLDARDANACPSIST